MTRRRHAWTGGLAAILLIAAGIAGPRVVAAGEPCAMPARPEGLVGAAVRRVVDGDTLIARLADGRRERVRLIGIDAPELDASAMPDEAGRPDSERGGAATGVDDGPGRRAARFLAATLPAGRRVGLELDVEHRDVHGRLLAYVWRDGALVNLTIVEAGYAQLLTIPPNVRHASRFRECLREARLAGRGLWAPPAAASR